MFNDNASNIVMNTEPEKMGTVLAVQHVRLYSQHSHKIQT